MRQFPEQSCELVHWLEARAIKQKMIEMELHCNGNMFVDYRQNEQENRDGERERNIEYATCDDIRKIAQISM